jgi:hypothetical protein
VSIEIKESHKGKLHRRMGVPAGHKIGIGDLMREKAKARREHDPSLMKEATFALNARKWNHG